ncbi:MAG: hypothetical protein ACFFA7_16995 [Promethearchaeota archaeon]
MSSRKNKHILKNIFKFFKTFTKIIFYPFLIITIIIFIFNQILGILLAVIFFLLYFLSYLITLSSKKRLLASIQSYSLINDTEISEKLKRPVEDIRKILSSLSKHQKRKNWLVVFLNKRYIFLNENGVENYKQLHMLGYNEKKILEELQPEMNIRSRAEVKAIEITLANLNRLNN